MFWLKGPGRPHGKHFLAIAEAGGFLLPSKTWPVSSRPVFTRVQDGDFLKKAMYYNLHHVEA